VGSFASQIVLVSNYVVRKKLDKALQWDSILKHTAYYITLDIIILVRVITRILVSFFSLKLDFISYT